MLSLRRYFTADGWKSTFQIKFNKCLRCELFSVDVFDDWWTPGRSPISMNVFIFQFLVCKGIEYDLTREKKAFLRREQIEPVWRCTSILRKVHLSDLIFHFGGDKSLCRMRNPYNYSHFNTALQKMFHVRHNIHNTINRSTFQICACHILSSISMNGSAENCLMGPKRIYLPVGQHLHLVHKNARE